MLYSPPSGCFPARVQRAIKNVTFSLSYHHILHQKKISQSCGKSDFTSKDLFIKYYHWIIMLYVRLTAFILLKGLAGHQMFKKNMWFNLGLVSVDVFTKISIIHLT